MARGKKSRTIKEKQFRKQIKEHRYEQHIQTLRELPYEPVPISYAISLFRDRLNLVVDNQFLPNGSAKEVDEYMKQAKLIFLTTYFGDYLKIDKNTFDGLEEYTCCKNRFGKADFALFLRKELPGGSDFHPFVKFRFIHPQRRRTSTWTPGTCRIGYAVLHFNKKFGLEVPCDRPSTGGLSPSRREQNRQIRNAKVDFLKKHFRSVLKDVKGQYWMCYKDRFDALKPSLILEKLSAQELLPFTPIRTSTMNSTVTTTPSQNQADHDHFVEILPAPSPSTTPVERERRRLARLNENLIIIDSVSDSSNDNHKAVLDEIEEVQVISNPNLSKPLRSNTTTPPRAYVKPTEMDQTSPSTRPSPAIYNLDSGSDSSDSSCIEITTPKKRKRIIALSSGSDSLEEYSPRSSKRSNNTSTPCEVRLHRMSPDRLKVIIQRTSHIRRHQGTSSTSRQARVLRPAPTRSSSGSESDSSESDYVYVRPGKSKGRSTTSSETRFDERRSPSSSAGSSYESESDYGGSEEELEHGKGPIIRPIVILKTVEEKRQEVAQEIQREEQKKVQQEVMAKYVEHFMGHLPYDPTPLRNAVDIVTKSLGWDVFPYGAKILGRSLRKHELDEMTKTRGSDEWTMLKQQFILNHFSEAFKIRKDDVAGWTFCQNCVKYVDCRAFLKIFWNITIH